MDDAGTDDAADSIFSKYFQNQSEERCRNMMQNVSEKSRADDRRPPVEERLSYFSIRAIFCGRAVVLRLIR